MHACIFGYTRIHNGFGHLFEVTQKPPIISNIDRMEHETKKT